MPDATFLHIRGRDDSPTRVLELPIGPIRVGRGPLCEVRLADPALGDVQCMLRRRGNTWHFQPVGPPGRVWIEGRPADQQRPLPMGLTLRVGEHWLTLQAAEGTAEAWGTFDAPIAVEPDQAETAAPPPAEPEPEPEPEPPGPERARAATAAAPEADDERLRRWQARLDQREQWLKDRQDEKRWEARWKAAGETIRARSTGPAVPTSSPEPRTSPPPAAPRPRPPMPPGRTVEPRPAPSFRRIADPTPRSSPSRVPLRPATGPAVSQPPAAPAPPIRSEPRIPTTRALVALPAPSIDWSGARVEPVTPAPDRVAEAEFRSPMVEPARPIELPPTDAPAEPEPAAPDDSEAAGVEILAPTPDLPAVAEPPGSASEIPPPLGDEPGAPVVEPEAVAIVEPASVLEGDLADTDPIESEPEAILEAAPEPEALPSPRESADRADPAPIALRGLSEVLGAAPPIVEAPPALIPEPAESGLSYAEWPSARSIFAAQGSRSTGPAPEPLRRRRAEPSPTDASAPASWSIPAWLGIIPAVGVALALGGGGLALAYEWSIDDSSADQAMALALRPEGTPAPAIDPSSLPRGGWWRSTAPHLSAWAVALARSTDGEDHAEDIRAMSDAARHASPLAASTRFAIEPPARPEADGSPDLAHLGRTRDVVTLSWTGRRLRQSGKVDASLRAYRSALAIAARARPGELDAPGFDEDTAVRRYRLPRESMIGSVVLDMARAGEWTPEQWAEAIPGSAAAPLIASRVLRKANQPAEADRLVDLAIARADTPEPPGFDPAEHRAAVAEAMATRGRWADAVEQYRRAIDAADDDSTRRRWHLNLAEVAYQARDDATRTRSIEAAKAPDSADEITRRALRHQQSNPGLASRGDRP